MFQVFIFFELQTKQTTIAEKMITAGSVAGSMRGRQVVLVTDIR